MIHTENTEDFHIRLFPLRCVKVLKMWKCFVSVMFGWKVWNNVDAKPVWKQNVQRCIDSSEHELLTGIFKENMPLHLNGIF